MKQYKPATEEYFMHVKKIHWVKVAYYAFLADNTYLIYERKKTLASQYKRKIIYEDVVLVFK